MMEFPKPPKQYSDTPGLITANEEKKNLSVNEVTFILRSTLAPHHVDDPIVNRFITSYLMCRSVPQAAKEAGIDTRSGRNLLNRKDIHQAISKVAATQAMKSGLDPEAVIERVREVVEIDVSDVYRADGSFKHLSEMKPETQRAIKRFKAKNLYDKDPNGMKVLVGELIEVEFYDKLKGVELLGPEVGVFKKTQVVEHGVTSDMREILLASVERAEERVKTLKEVGPTLEIEGKNVTEEQV
jgi:phage baseplate assembly protein W